MAENTEKKSIWAKTRELKAKIFAFAAQSAEHKELVSKIKFEGGEVVTTDNAIIVFDGDVLTENMPVQISLDGISAPVPVPDGDYTLQTGEVITVVGSVVTKIVPPANGGGSQMPPDNSGNGMPPATTPQSNGVDTNRQPSKTVESHTVESYFSKLEEVEKIFSEHITKLSSENKQLSEKIEALTKENQELKKTPVSDPAKTAIELAAQKTESGKESKTILQKNLDKLFETN